MKSASKQEINFDGTDTVSKSKRLRFDEEGEIEAPKKPKLLLESDEEDEEFVFPEDSEFKSKSRAKLAKLQSSIGTDERFAVDERFLEDEDIEDDQQKEEEEIDEHIDEKTKQLEILGSILGKPIAAKKSPEKDKKAKSIGGMIRYDPADEQHQEYEILPEKKEKVKKKKKKEIEIVEKPEVPEVSKERSYVITDSKLLTSVFGKEEKISLLQAFGKEAPESDNEKVETSCESSSKNKIFGFSSSRAFKYDTSDDEDVTEDSKKTERKFESEKIESSNFIGSTDRFFFIIDDSRFQECEEFFKKPSEHSENLKTLRPKLKQTIRKRIRTNLKKNSTQRKRLRKKY
ncbi:nucleolar protein 8-like [Leptopilina heterotoma]|uniref:nucleolar protein 8-like n=1 Tax=Leptopilina heterotoma TaxID=63436 RepID=UPI001CA9B1CA|nr:nucleolar protein 8-like [Leptopilina heterotoma]